MNTMLTQASSSFVRCAVLAPEGAGGAYRAGFVHRLTVLPFRSVVARRAAKRTVSARAARVAVSASAADRPLWCGFCALCVRYQP